MQAPVIKDPSSTPVRALIHPLNTSSSNSPPSIAINDVMPPRERETYALYSDYATKNYPPPGDSTPLPIID
jgi:hypothetical protein